MAYNKTAAVMRSVLRWQQKYSKTVPFEHLLSVLVWEFIFKYFLSIFLFNRWHDFIDIINLLNDRSVFSFQHRGWQSGKTSPREAATPSALYIRCYVSPFLSSCVGQTIVWRMTFSYDKPLSLYPALLICSSPVDTGFCSPPCKPAGIHVPGLSWKHNHNHTTV